MENLESTHTRKKRILEEVRAHIPTGTGKLAKTARGIGVRVTGPTGHIKLPRMLQTGGNPAFRTITTREGIAATAKDIGVVAGL